MTINFRFYIMMFYIYTTKKGYTVTILSKKYILTDYYFNQKHNQFVFASKNKTDKLKLPADKCVFINL